MQATSRIPAWRLTWYRIQALSATLDVDKPCWTSVDKDRLCLIWLDEDALILACLHVGDSAWHTDEYKLCLLAVGGCCLAILHRDKPCMTAQYHGLFCLPDSITTPVLKGYCVSYMALIRPVHCMHFINHCFINIIVSAKYVLCIFLCYSLPGFPSQDGRHCGSYMEFGESQSFMYQLIQCSKCMATAHDVVLQ